MNITLKVRDEDGQIVDKVYKLDRKDVAVATKVVNDMIRESRGILQGDECNRFYLTLLIVMHIVSQSLINEFDEEALRKIFGKGK